MTRRRVQAVDSPIWECRVCLEQFFSGPRCPEHSPTPEEREANPEKYPRSRYHSNIKELRPELRLL